MTSSASFLSSALPPLLLMYLATPCISDSLLAPVSSAATTTTLETGKSTFLGTISRDESVILYDHHATKTTANKITKLNRHAESQPKTQPKNPSKIKSTDAISRPNDERLSQKLLSTQDPFIRASPLNVAAVCNDGIAMVSLHFPLDEEDDEWEKVESSHESDESQESTKKNSFLRAFRDLPIISRGPLRIEPINDHFTATAGSPSSRTHPPPMALLTAGWRTDGMALADAARELMGDETMLYTLPQTVSAMIQIDFDDDYNYNGDSRLADELDRSVVHDLLQQEQKHNQQQQLETASSDNEDQALSKLNLSTPATVQSSRINRMQQKSPCLLPKSPVSVNQYARRISEGLSYYMAKCSFSEGMRSLSCVGLLACGGSNNSNSGNESGTLHLIDVTGIHPVRAHAIGNGAIVINERLGFVDFRGMDCQEGLRVLLRLIAEEGGLVDSCESSSGGQNNNGQDREHDVKPGSNLVEESEYANELVLKGTLDTDEESFRDSEYDRASSSMQSTPWNLPQNTAVELAVLRTRYGRMKRIRLSSLL
mmetsp:Transcript_13265/g.27837  ORF Transcript_13265/g.27837 Transcript_13265/m.27837 type:complete len:541 (-) Transcript_13265:290-1912(-)